MNSKDLNANVIVKIDAPVLEPIAEAAAEITKDTSSGLRSFLDKVCMRAAEQIGLGLEEKVLQWRHTNRINYLAKAEKLHTELGIDSTYTVNPRLMIAIDNGASLQDDDQLQDWWSGIMVSSCEPEESDANLIFVDLMNRITKLQARVIRYACKEAEVVHSSRGLLMAKPVKVSQAKLAQITCCEGIDQLDRELDSLCNLGFLELFSAGLNLHEDELVADITPTSLALHFYARCNGRTDNLIEFFGASLMDTCPNCGGLHT